jgi:WD40 repeat protein
MRHDKKWALLIVLGCIVAALCQPAWAAGGAPVISAVPPDFILDKQLPGEDPYWVYRPVFSPDGRFAAGFLHSSHKIIIWNLEEGKIIKEIDESVHGMPALDGWEYSRDGKMLLLIYRDLPLKFLDISEGKVVRTIDMKADPKKVWDYSFSPDMKLLALATNNGIKLWDIEKGAELKVFLKDKAVSSVDLCFYRNEKGQPVRLMAYGLLLMKAQDNKDVAGIIDIDGGSARPVLNDVPKDKVIKGDGMTILWVKWESGGGYLMVAYCAIPPKVKAGVYLVNGRTGKYLANHDLDQLTLGYNLYYLWKPYYGYLVNTKDMTSNPYKIATEFLVITKDYGLKVVDNVREDKIPVQSITISRDIKWAIISQKKSQEDTSKVYLYKVVPRRAK